MTWPGISRPLWRGKFHQTMKLLAIALLLGFSAIAISSNRRNDPVRIVFMEPDASGAEHYKPVADPARIQLLRKWMDNESARMALDLFRRAWAFTPERAKSPVYYVALVDGGNDGAVGFQLAGDLADHTKTSFIKLAPEDWAFSSTLLHETGHVILSMLNGGAPIPKREMAAISHSTATLTDRGTAFDEGFAIHLETLAAHHSTDPEIINRYDHRRFMFGVPYAQGEFHRRAMDLLTFSQTNARYYEVRENNFAFSPAYQGPDYLRVQLERSRDFSSLRDPDQLLQSEGFTASFFFCLTERGMKAPSIKVIQERQERMLAVLSDMLGKGVTSEDPFLLKFVETYIHKFPAEAGEVVDVLLDLSHGVFVDKSAEGLWRAHYLGALRLDMAERSNKSIEEARARWHAAVIKDPTVLYANLGPQIRVTVPAVSVELLALEEKNALSFDVNTVEPGVIRMIPGISESEVASWLSARKDKPFADAEDFRVRSGIGAATFAQLKF